MLFSFVKFSPPQTDKTKERLPVRKRRGVTSLEYLAVISLILIVLILTIQQLGMTVGGLFTSDAQAISATVK
jgi:Flp pilus assembly pilin Flp